MADFSPDAVAKITETVRDHLNLPRNERRLRSRWHRSGGGGGGNVVAFQLNADLLSNSSAAGNILDWDPSSETYSTGAAITVDDALGSISSGVIAKNGAKGYAQVRPGSSGPIYEVISFTQAARILRCQVNDASGVLPSDTTFAVDGATLLQPDTAVLGTVTTLTNTLKLTLGDNAPVIAVLNTATSNWEAIAPNRIPALVATMVQAAADGAVDAADSTFSVDTITVIMESGASVPTISTVQNTFGFAIDDSGWVILVEKSGDWVCIQAECPA